MYITVGEKKFEVSFLKDETEAKTIFGTQRQYQIKLVNGNEKLLGGKCDMFFGNEQLKTEFGITDREIKFGYLANFGVASEFRSHGLGKELLKQIINDNPNCVIGLCALTNSDKIIPQSTLVKLYEKVGFKLIGYRELYYIDFKAPKMIFEPE